MWEKAFTIWVGLTYWKAAGRDQLRRLSCEYYAEQSVEVKLLLNADEGQRSQSPETIVCNISERRMEINALSSPEIKTDLEWSKASLLMKFISELNVNLQLTKPKSYLASSDTELNGKQTRIKYKFGN